ncbi:MAG: endonuclease MutS2 [Synergistaceae bacterium]|nr:endonuclease MutS2 [Synergistaceae bacterium]
MLTEISSYNSLEIKKIIQLISKHCRSEIGEEAAFAALPAQSLDDLRARHELFSSIEDYREKKGELPWQKGLASVTPILAEAEETGILTGEELLKIRHLIKLSMKIKEVLGSEKEKYPIFSLIIKDIRDFTKEIESLSVIDDDGRLYDSASEKLKSLREKIKELRETIRRKGHALINYPTISGMLQERVMTIRNERYTFLVRPDALSLFPGTVVDRSVSGNSVYMEPNSMVRINNEFTSCRNSEIYEEQKILRELTAIIQKKIKGILDAEKVIGTIDLFYALSEKKRLERWTMPELSSKTIFSFKKARHPLLFDKAVPIDIGCGDKYRILVITGPNTGGKTVALKTAGVCVILGWMGFPIPAAGGSVLGIVDELFADIGDEQSIEQSLSTFSAHVKNVTEILGRAGSNSLVLLDELGAGTDPEEGAALGIAILDWLREKKTLVLATTHHNPIKRFALAAPSVETASVEFDITTLSPTYKILTGIPGRSNALLIAGKLGMPTEVIKRAEKAINGKEISMEDLIAELHGKRSKLEKESIEVENSLKELERLKNNYEEKVREIEERREVLIAKADKKALNIVKNAEESAKALIKNIESAEVESAARRELEKKRSHFHKIEKSADQREEKKITEQSAAAKKEALKEGDTVRIIGTKGVASVLEVKGKKILVQAGAAQVEVPLNKLSLVPQKEIPKTPPPVQVRVSRPKGVPSEIMVRGMTIDEAIPIVEQYLDQAYRAGYDSVTVIHGRGEGILRREVQELCKRTPYVIEHNLGGPHDGGYGVTIVRFRK